VIKIHKNYRDNLTFTKGHDENIAVLFDQDKNVSELQPFGVFKNEVFSNSPSNQQTEISQTEINELELS